MLNNYSRKCFISLDMSFHQCLKRTVELAIEKISIHTITARSKSEVSFLGAIQT